MRERSLSAVPGPLRVMLVATLVAQIGFALLQPRPSAIARDLPVLPSAAVLRVASLGDPIPLAQMLMLYLQAFDTQPGISIPFLDLDYARVEQWLGRILELDPAGQYPLLAASEVYTQVPDPQKQRHMLEFIYDRFLEDPNRRWPWLAHAAILARHRLNDPALALRYAEALRRRATGRNVPGWAKQMEIFLRADLGEHEAAKALLGGLLASGTITDPHEIRFLIERLQQIKSAENSSKSSKK